MNVDQNYLETEFSFAICHPTGDKWQSKTLVIVISDPRSSIDKRAFDCCLSGVETKLFFQQKHGNVNYS